MSIADLRKEYTREGLREDGVDRDPFRQFWIWFDQAQQAQIHEPNAMTLASTSMDGQPSSRIVLLKGITEQGLLFFTSYEGRKARELEKNPRVALLFYWAELERQVRVEGSVEKLPVEESETYFAGRPRGSQLGAWVSPQSSVISGREWLDERLRQLEARFAGQSVPRPPDWGGYLVRPRLFEFWQGQRNRLHDRLRYTPTGPEGWKIERLAP